MSTAEAVTTTDADEIKQWVEERGGVPAKVKTGAKEGSGILRIDFPGYGDEESLEKISWEEWFEIFEKRQLAFLYQEKLSSGKESRFFKLVNREEGKHKK